MEYFLINTTTDYDAGPLRQATESADVGIIIYLMGRYGPSTLMSKAAAGAVLWYLYQSFTSNKQLGNIPPTTTTTTRR